MVSPDPSACIALVMGLAGILASTQGERKTRVRTIVFALTLIGIVLLLSIVPSWIGELRHNHQPGSPCL